MPLDKNADNIQVILRVRPLNDREAGDEKCVRIDHETNGTLILQGTPEKYYSFDWVGGEESK
jgi:hypothetical protein